MAIEESRLEIVAQLEVISHFGGSVEDERKMDKIAYTRGEHDLIDGFDIVTRGVKQVCLAIPCTNLSETPLYRWQLEVQRRQMREKDSTRANDEQATATEYLSGPNVADTIVVIVQQRLGL